MNILFASSEAYPFFTSGKLGDMIGSLAVAMRRQGTDVRVILPLYGDMREEWRGQLRYITNFNVPVSWRNQYCGLFELVRQGVTYYFLDNEYYFKRQGFYGFYDDGERFSFFSRAVLETVARLDHSPHIIHCNDWQTALIPVYLKLYYRHIEKYAPIKTIFTIHDIQYQGKYGPEILEGTLGIGRENFHLVEYDGIVNYMKGAIESADLVSTVSPAYVEEILDPWYGCGLDSFLRLQKHKLRGILSGIDQDEYNPATDAYIAAQYDADSFETGKPFCKEGLRNLFGLTKHEAPLIGMVIRFESHKGLDLLIHGADEILGGGMQLALIGYGGGVYERFFGELAARWNGQCAVRFGFLPELARQVYSGSDLFLMPSKFEPCGLAQMIALRYGSIPIVRQTGGLRDTITEGKDGNGFSFVSYSADELRDACFRARDAWQDKNAWSALVHRAMRCDCGWDKPSQRYLELYQQAMKL
ncbi:glycogen synthase [Treponema sp. TIM-1]|uniref:glycogen synthase n=1 Tax=Treponema sp. TIM-1 TaxID=2898417 RepID=UPI00397FC870